MSSVSEKEVLLTAFDAWKIYMAIKLHYRPNNSYDCFQYSFQTKNFSMTNFQSRPDRYFFEKFSEKFRKPSDWIKFVVSNIVFGKNNWIGDFDMSVYRKFAGRLESITYRFESDLKKLRTIDPSLDSLLSSKGRTTPMAVKTYLASQINLETVIVLEILTQFVSRAKIKEDDDLLWPDVKNTIVKTSPFIAREIDRKKMRKKVLSVFTG